MEKQLFALKCAREHRSLLFPVCSDTVAVVFSCHAPADRTTHQSLQKLAAATVLLWELAAEGVWGKDGERGITDDSGKDRVGVGGGLAASHTRLASLCGTRGIVI